MEEELRDSRLGLRKVLNRRKKMKEEYREIEV